MLSYHRYPLNPIESDFLSNSFTRPFYSHSSSFSDPLPHFPNGWIRRSRIDPFSSLLLPSIPLVSNVPFFSSPNLSSLPSLSVNSLIEEFFNVSLGKEEHDPSFHSEENSSTHITRKQNEKPNPNKSDGKQNDISLSSSVTHSPASDNSSFPVMNTVSGANNPLKDSTNSSIPIPKSSSENSLESKLIGSSNDIGSSGAVESGKTPNFEISDEKYESDSKESEEQNSPHLQQQKEDSTATSNQSMINTDKGQDNNIQIKQNNMDEPVSNVASPPPFTPTITPREPQSSISSSIPDTISSSPQPTNIQQAKTEKKMRNTLGSLPSSLIPTLLSHPLSSLRSLRSLDLHLTVFPTEYEYITTLPSQITRDQLNLSYEGDILTLNAHMKEEEKDESGNIVASNERQITRAVKLPQDADKSKIQAKWQQGKLIIKIGRIQTPLENQGLISIQ